MADLPGYILDAFAFLAYLENEPAAPRIEKVLQDAEAGKCRAYISIINLGEILYTIERKYGLPKAQDTLALIQKMPVEILPADSQTVLAAAHIKANHPVSYADAFVVAAAQKNNGVIMTGDPEFQEVTDLAKIEWLRRKS
jgi:predicted nucleic acid-binding protein